MATNARVSAVFISVHRLAKKKPDGWAEAGGASEPPGCRAGRGTGCMRVRIGAGYITLQNGAVKIVGKENPDVPAALAERIRALHLAGAAPAGAPTVARIAIHQRRLERRFDRLDLRCCR